MTHCPVLTSGRAFVACILLLGGSPAAPGAQPSGDARALIQQADQRIKELQAEADRLANQARTLLSDLRGLELEREIKAQEARKADVELERVTEELNRAIARADELGARRAAETPGVNERLAELYKRGRGGYLQLLLQSDDLRALGRMSRGVASVVQLDRARFDAHRRTVRQQLEAIKELDARRAAVQSAQQEAKKARAALSAAIAAQNQRIDELDRRRDLAAQYVGELQSAQAALQQRIGGIATAGPTALPLAPFRGSLEWPVGGQVVSRFGRNPANRLASDVVRNGIEITAVPAQQVRAVHGGTVAYAAPFNGFGTLVILDHGDAAFTLYGHLSKADVAEGATVERGTIVGRTGRSPEGASVLYFELRIDGRPVDPVQWLRGSR